MKIHLLYLQFRLAADFSPVWKPSDSTLIYCYRNSLVFHLLVFIGYWLYPMDGGKVFFSSICRVCRTPFSTLRKCSLFQRLCCC